MTSKGYRERLSKLELNSDEINTLVESKIAKGEITDSAATQEDLILKAATDAVNEVFPDVVKAEEDAPDADASAEEKKKDEEEDDDVTEKSSGEDLAMGVDANGRGPASYSDDHPSTLSEEFDRAGVEMSAVTSKYGKGVESEEMDLMKGQEDYDLVAIISKGADDIVGDVRRQNEVLAKGYLAVSDVVKSLNATNEETKIQVGHLNQKVDALLKAIGQPVPPRSVIDVDEIEVIASPHENLSKSTISSTDVIAKAHEELRAGADSNRAAELSMAVAMLESGVDPKVVAESAKLVIN